MRVGSSGEVGAYSRSFFAKGVRLRERGWVVKTAFLIRIFLSVCHMACVSGGVCMGWYVVVSFKCDSACW